MPTLNEFDSNTVRLTDQVLNEELLSPFSLTMEPNFTDIASMRRFAVAAKTAMDFNRSVDETREALRTAAGALTKAHEAAAAIVVPELEEDDIAEFKSKLEDLDRDLQADERFRMALALSQALVSTMENIT